MVQHIDGADFKTAIRTLAGDDGETVKQLAGFASEAKPAVHQETESDAQKTARALRIWNEGSPVNDTLAEEYLKRRGLELPDDDHALRYYSPCPFAGTAYPAMIAMFRDVLTDAPRAIHRVALGPGGILIAKRMLGRVAGCAVKLDADADVEHGLAVGEGIETMIAARMRGFRPAWALGSAGTLKTFPVLGGVECLSIIVDHDPPDKNGRQCGQEAAAECSERWTSAGREVRRILPRRQGADMADLAEAPHE